MSDATVAPPVAVAAPPSGRVRPAFGDFLRACALLGATGFGGGLAILSQAGELFERKRWLTDREWVHTATVAQLLPGGAATNALAYVGLRFYGAIGAFAAVGVYIAPSMVAMIALALAYGFVHGIRQFDAILAGSSAALVGLVVAVTWKLGQGGLKRTWQAVLAALALALERLGHATVLEVIVFGILAGLAVDSLQKGWRLRERRKRQRREEGGVEPVPPGGEGAEAEDPRHPGHRPSQPPPPAKAGAPPATNGDAPSASKGDARPAARGDAPPARKGPPDEGLHAFFLPFAAALARDAQTVWAALGTLFLPLMAVQTAPDVPAPQDGRIRRMKNWLVQMWAGLTPPLAIALLFTFARVGAIAYGGGFTIVPLLEREAVERHRWITSQEFADAIAFGQITPGPVLIAATFIGARAGGILGGLAATIGVFGVPVLITVLGGAWLDRWRRARMVKAALRGLVPAVVGMMAAAAIALAKAGIPDEAGIILAVSAFVAVTKYKANPALVVAGTGAARLLLALVVK